MLRRGFKQGDPLSPLRLNLAVDPLLYALERQGNGFDTTGASVTSPAFADDLVLVSSSWHGMSDMLDKLSKAYLKPFQHLEVRKVYAIHRTMDVAGHGRAGKALLSECDRDIRSRVKAWLHLEPSTADGLLYASPRDGGLGIIKVTKHIPAVQLRRLVKLYNSSDECTKTIMRAAVPLSKLPKLWSLLQDNTEGRILQVVQARLKGQWCNSLP